MSENEIIAQFMGVTTHFDMIGNENPDYNCWDFIMPVCEEITKLGDVDVIICVNGSVIITFDDGVAYFKQTKSEGRGPIEVIKEAIIDFILWYNNNHI